MTLSDFILMAIYAIAFRWMIFDYKRTAIFRDFARRFTFTHPLLDCVYCQAIECATVVAIAKPYIDVLFAILAVGLIAIVVDSSVDKAIGNMEIIRNKQDGDKINPSQDS
jgi:hypothetical protein